MFLVDGSGSVEAYGRGNFKRCLNFVKQVASSFTISKADGHVSVTVFSSRAQVIFDLNRYTNINQIFQAVDGIKYPRRGTRTGLGLKTVFARVLSGARKGTPRVLIVMTDGRTRDKISMISRKFHKAGVAVYAIGVGRKYREKELRIMASSPKPKHVLKIEFSLLTNLISKLQADVCKGNVRCYFVF